MPGVHQPDPPGLIHDDLRLLPPWRGSSLFRTLFVDRIVGEVRVSCGISFSLPSRHDLCTVRTPSTEAVTALASRRTTPTVWTDERRKRRPCDAC
jgi:hypothetical protein